MYDVCELCEISDATIDTLCAECFWEEDAKLKRERRSDPRWIFHRRYSALIELEHKSPEEAIFMCMQWWIRYHIGIHIGMSHDTAVKWSPHTFKHPHN